MVIDSSALVAILLREPDADEFSAAIAAARPRLIGSPSVLETTMVMVGKFGPAGRAVVARLLQDTAAEIVSFTAAHAELAITAFLRFGKGRHAAALNFGDCCSYALAAERGLSLLYKGSDFAHTDLRSGRLM